MGEQEAHESGRVAGDKEPTVWKGTMIQSQTLEQLHDDKFRGHHTQGALVDHAAIEETPH